MLQLHQLADDFRTHQKLIETSGVAGHQGFAVLFAGPSGTGKTMAANGLARALDLHLFRIDLSQVASKYIGETEKNLGRIFDEASKGGWILFFDEADALLGKRTDVKDSHDRHASVETNFLLQRIEDHDGLVILATNRKSALDEAFMRRLRFVVEFPVPDTDERTKFRKPLLDLNPSDPLDLTFALKKAIKQSGMTLAEITAAMKQDYGVEISVSGLSRAISRGTLRFERAVQILAICGVKEVEIKR